MTLDWGGLEVRTKERAGEGVGRVGIARVWETKTGKGQDTRPWVVAYKEIHFCRVTLADF